MLTDLAGGNSVPVAMAYELCSMIFENYSNLTFFPFVASRLPYLDPQHSRIPAELTHAERYQQVADAVFRSGDDEIIADLLHAWTSHGDSHNPPSSLDVVARHIVGLQPPSQRRSPEAGSMTEKDVPDAMPSLFRQRPGAILKLE